MGNWLPQKRIFQNCIKIVKNGLSLGPFFLEIFYRTPPIFLQNLKVLAMSFSKLFLHVLKVHILMDLCSIKVRLWKTKNLSFNGITQNFVFHRQTSKVNSSLKRWTFWTCKNSFEKFVARALRFCKNIWGIPLKKSKKRR